MKNQRTKQRNTSQQQKLQKTLPDNTLQQSRQRYRVENTTILMKYEKLKYPNSSHNTTTEITAEYPVNINALLRKIF